MAIRHHTFSLLNISHDPSSSTRALNGIDKFGNDLIDEETVKNRDCETGDKKIMQLDQI